MQTKTRKKRKKKTQTQKTQTLQMLLHEITSFGPSLQLCSHVGWGRQQQDPGEPGRCRLGTASEGSPALGQRGCSACSALVLSAGSQHPPRVAGLPYLTAASQGFLPREAAQAGVGQGVMMSGAVWSSPPPAAGSWTQLPPLAQAHCRESHPIPAVGVCCHVSGSSARLQQPNRDKNEKQPTIPDSA